MLSPMEGISVSIAHPRRRRLLFILLGVVLVTILVWMLAWFYPPARTSILLWAVRGTVPEELTSVVFVAESTEGSLLYPGLSRQEKLPGTLVSATKDELGSAQILRTGSGKFQVVVDGTTVVEDTKPRMGIARSPSGMRVAYAEAIEPSAFLSPASAPILSADRKSWRVVVYEPETRSSFVLGLGGAPVFLDDTHIVWMAPAGLAIADLQTAKTTLLLPETEAHIPLSTLRSPDGKTIGWYAKGGQQVTLYRLGDDTVSPLQTIALPKGIVSATLGDGALYSIRIRPWMTSVLTQPIAGGEPETVMTIPNPLRIQRLLIGNL